MTIQDYPNLLEVYLSSEQYLVVDRSIERESFYHENLAECLTDITDPILRDRNPMHHKFQYYLYRGKSFLTLASLANNYPEVLI